MKKRFILVDYELDIIKKMQGLKQGAKIVQEYIKDVHKILITIRHAEAIN